MYQMYDKQLGLLLFKYQKKVCFQNLLKICLKNWRAFITLIDDIKKLLTTKPQDKNIFTPGPNIWNNLFKDIQNASNIKKFKAQFRNCCQV